MEEGQLVEMGTHDELLALDGLYEELLKCEGVSKHPRRMLVRNYKETSTLQIEKDYSSVNIFQESSSPKLIKSLSLQRVLGVFWPQDGAFNSHESPKAHSPSPEEMLENGLPVDAGDKELQQF